MTQVAPVGEDGKFIKLDFCKECAKEKGILEQDGQTALFGPSVAELISHESLHRAISEVADAWREILVRNHKCFEALSETIRKIEAKTAKAREAAIEKMIKALEGYSGE